MSTKYRYLVLGTGVGKAIAHTLKEHHQTALVTIGDKLTEQIHKTVEYVNSISSNPESKCNGLKFDAENFDGSYFKNFDVIISALPAKYNLELAAHAAICYGKSFCDLGGVVKVTKEMMDFITPASVIPDCGIMPGLGMLLTRELMSGMQSVDDIKIFVGGLPQKPRSPVFYQKVFSLEGLKHICFDEVPVLENGKIKMLPPFSMQEPVFAEELKNFSEDFGGLLEAFATAGASISPWSLQKEGVKNFVEKTVRWPGFIDFVKPLPRKGFEEAISPYINIPTTADNPDLLWGRVDVIGVKDGIRIHREVKILDFFDSGTSLTAMERTTGITTGLVAALIAQGKAKPGVHTMDEALNPKTRKDLIADLQKHFSITFREEAA